MAESRSEGSGCVNDFTRGYATLALKLLLAERLKCPMADVEARVAIVMSGGTEGGLSPHLLVFCRETAAAAAAGPRLAIGVGLTRAFKPEEIGRAPQIEATTKAVTAAMADAGIIDAEAARRVLARLGGEAVAVLAKAEAAPSGEIRGRRHTMLDDSDIHSTRHARALVGGVLAGVIGDTLLYVSSGAEHQGPPGGGPVAIIGRL